NDTVLRDAKLSREFVTRLPAATRDSRAKRRESFPAREAANLRWATQNGDRTMSIRIVYAALLLAASVACGSSSPSTPTPTPTPGPSGASVGASIVAGSSTLTTTAYSPNPIAVSVGGAVTWTNADVVTHTSTAGGGAWNSGSIAPGGTF